MSDADADAETTPAGWLAALRAAFARSLSDGHRCWRDAEARMPSAALAARAMDALEAMRATDPTSWGMRACDVVRRHGGAAEAARLRAVRHRLPAVRALRDWRLEADRALSVIDARTAGRCACEAEARHGVPIAGPAWQVEHEEVDHAGYAINHRVRCAACGRRYRVVQQEGYHYPIFRWTPLATEP